MSMNINASNNYSLNSINTINKSNTSALKPNINHVDKQTSKTGLFSPHGNVIVETDSNNLYQPKEIFNIMNDNKNWLLDGEEVGFKNLDNESKGFLFEFSNVHKQYSEETEGNTNFGDLVVKLGNAYASKREELAEKYSGDELNEKLSKLEKSFKMYTETKIVGNIYEVGSMANVAHFDLIEAKTAKFIKERQEAIRNGKDIGSVKNENITGNDKQTFSELLKQAKGALNNVAEFFNKNGTLSANQIGSLYSYTGENGSWSLGKLNMTFELLDSTKKSNTERYSQEEFNKVMNSEDANKFFTDDEKNIFEKIYNSYNQILQLNKRFTWAVDNIYLSAYIFIKLALNVFLKYYKIVKETLELFFNNGVGRYIMCVFKKVDNYKYFGYN